jgi:SAM-dependent methyltransferase
VVPDPTDAEQAAEAALRRATGGRVPGLTAVDVAPLPGGGERTTSVWEVDDDLWRTVVDTEDGAHTVVEVTDTSAPGRGARGWDEVHAGSTAPVADPDPQVVAALTGRPPGRALDVAAGRGRHSLWLASLGWDVTALDFSRAGLAALRGSADAAGLHVSTELGDARAFEPPAGTLYDLVLLSFVHLPPVLARAPRWVAPGGLLVVVGHARRNLVDGVGGPQDPRLLHDHVDLAARVTGARLRVRRAAEVARETPDGTALDVVVVAENPSAAD